VTVAERESFRELTREVVEWRLAEYLGPLEESGETESVEKAAPVASESRLELWQLYPRKQIAPLFGLKFSTGNWNAGFVRTGKHMFLLVTLDKDTKAPNFQYHDRFLTADTFQWQSQNQTTQASKSGREIRNHPDMGIQVHLFVRRDPKTPGGTGASFYYCGEVDFVEWHGEKPITVKWRLRIPLPERLQKAFQVPEGGRTATEVQS
jgi:hypothetical protein